jgi:UDP-glucose 4-epimerase
MARGTVLVTGGAGFIGSHLVEALVGEGFRVRVVDNLATGHRDNLASVAERIDFTPGDIRDEELMVRLAAGVDLVFHQAAVVSVPQSVEQPLFSAAVNELGTLTVLEAARRAGARRVVLASSSAVYGDDPAQPKQEAMSPDPLSPYAVQKLAGEYYAALYHRLHGMDTTALRYFNVYGPRQDPSSPYSGVISIFMSRAAAGAAPLIHGDGEQSRDFIYVTDVVRANLQAAQAPAAAGGVFNVATGRSVSINQLWAAVGRLAGVHLRPTQGPPRVGDVRESRANIAAAAGAFGLRPQVALDEGLARTYNWYRSQAGGRTD